MTTTNIDRIEEIVNRKVPILSLARKLNIPVISKSPTINFISCPVHSPGRQQKTPSCNLRTTDNGWHCFSCNSGGRVVDLAQEFHKDWSRETLLRWMIQEFNLVAKDPTLNEMLEGLEEDYAVVNFVETLKTNNKLMEMFSKYGLSGIAYIVEKEEDAAKIFELGGGLIKHSYQAPKLPWYVVQLENRPNYFAIFSSTEYKPWAVWGVNLGDFPIRTWAKEIRKNGKELNGRFVSDEYPQPFIIRFYIENPLDYLIFQQLKGPASLGLWEPGMFKVPKLKFTYIAGIVYNPIDNLNEEKLEILKAIMDSEHPIIFRESGLPSPWYMLLDGQLTEDYVDLAISKSQSINL